MYILVKFVLLSLWYRLLMFLLLIILSVLFIWVFLVEYVVLFKLSWNIGRWFDKLVRSRFVLYFFLSVLLKMLLIKVVVDFVILVGLEMVG